MQLPNIRTKMVSLFTLHNCCKKIIIKVIILLAVFFLKLGILVWIHLPVRNGKPRAVHAAIFLTAQNTFQAHQ